MLTQSQVKWAKSHDWFIASNGNVQDGFSILVEDREAGKASTYARFRDFALLRAWAGY